MSVFERIDWFSASLPKMCIYCAYGYPVVFGVYDWLDVFACGAHLVENLKSKKTTLDKHRFESSDPDGPARNVYMPLVGPRDRCDLFAPIRLDGAGSGSSTRESSTCSTRRGCSTISATTSRES